MLRSQARELKKKTAHMLQMLLLHPGAGRVGINKMRKTLYSVEFFFSIATIGHV
jgi:hypothetical protein